MKELTEQDRKERVKRYRGIIADWEHVIEQLEQDILDLQKHIGVLESRTPTRPPKIVLRAMGLADFFNADLLDVEAELYQ